MTGFVALLALDGAPADRALLSSATASLEYRGTDGTDSWADGPIGLGAARFATTLQARGETQPLARGACRIVGDVRIDAREELVRALGAATEVDLDTTPDVELVLRAYERWGRGAFARLMGDFAFALWDGRDRALHCVRSPFGMRGLYYAHLGSTLVCSNSVHAIRVHPAVSERLDRHAVADFLLTGMHDLIDKSLTIHADIRSVPAAHHLSHVDGRVSVERYWAFPRDVERLRYASGRDYVEHFRQVFADAVRDRLRTDTVVLTMSGGLDSTTIGATLKALQREGAAAPRVQIVTAVFDRLPLPRERPYAALAARALGFPIRFLPADAYGLLDPPVPTAYPIEYYDPAYWVEFARVVASHARVQLTGQAGDNLLVPEPLLENRTHRRASIALLGAWLRQSIARRAIVPLGTGMRGGVRLPAPPWPYPAWLNPDLERDLDLQDRFTQWRTHRANATQGARDRVQASLEDYNWCEEDVFRSDFRFAEERDPFLDVRLLRFVLALPPVPWRFQKHIVRTAMSGRLPGPVLRRRKTLLGLLHEVLLESAEPRAVDGWTPHADLGRFVVRERVPALLGPASSTAQRYLDLRPLLLNSWLSNRW